MENGRWKMATGATCRSSVAVRPCGHAFGSLWLALSGFAESRNRPMFAAAVSRPKWGAFFAGFGVFVKKPAFFVKKQAHPSLEVPKSATNQCLSATNQCLSATNQCLSATNHCLSATNHCLSATNQCLSVTNQCLSMTNQRLSVTNQRSFAADLAWFKPDTSDKMAQNAALKAGRKMGLNPELETANVRSSPPIFCHQRGLAQISGSKSASSCRSPGHRCASGKRFFMRPPLFSYFYRSFNVPILKYGIQGVVYHTSNNVSAAWRFLCSGG